MADANTDNNESEQGERFSRNRGRGFGSKNRDTYFKHNDRRNCESSSSTRSNYRSNRGGSYRGGFRDSNFGRKPYKRVWPKMEGDGKRKRLEVGNRLKEPDVGVTEFISEHLGFSGLCKERYTDFHVNEISLDGKVAKLTNQIVPPSEPEETKCIEDLKKLVPDTIWEQLQTLKDGESSSSTVEIDVTDMDKDGRRAIHDIAKRFTNVKSQTIDHNGKKLMVIMKHSVIKGNAYKLRIDDRINWIKRGGDYCYFLLHKVNMDTMDALNQMAKILRVNASNFNYAGTKDRRAWTTQWVSFRKGLPDHILRAAKTIPGVFVGNFKYAPEPLKLGMLNGNRFRIALRNVTATDENIEKAMTSLRDHGFINYYGLQRFGTIAAIPTHEIGKKLLQGKWNEAIELILKPREGEQDVALTEARKIYETTKDAQAAYNRIKKSGKIEAELFKGLHFSSKTNPQGALDTLPRNARLMYIHAYQSFVWNHMVSRRIKEFGTRPIVGDLVYENNLEEKSSKDNVEQLCEDNTEETCLESDETNAVKEENKDDANEVTREVKDKVKKDEVKESADNTIENTNITETSGLKVSIEEKQEDAKMTESSDQNDTTDDIKEVTSATESSLNIEEKPNDNNTAGDKAELEDTYKLPSVKILTEEDLPHYTLADIIMPQPGWKVTYPPYAKPWFDEFLGKDELTTDLRRKNKKYSLGGTYRKILAIPLDLSWKIMHYKDKHSNLIASDLDEMRELTPPKDDPEGERKALIVEMSLRASTYATMALREILKQDTSAQAQAAQSAAYDALLESNKASSDKAGTSKSNNEDAQAMEKDEEDDQAMEKDEEDDQAMEKDEEDDQAMEKDEDDAQAMEKDEEDAQAMEKDKEDDQAMEKDKEDDQAMEEDEDAQAMEKDEESEKCDNVDEQMEVDSALETPAKDEKCLIEPEKETELTTKNVAS